MLCKQLNSNKAHRAIEILYTQYQDSQVGHMQMYINAHTYYVCYTYYVLAMTCAL